MKKRTNILFRSATALTLVTVMALSACQDRLTGWGTEIEYPTEQTDSNTLSFYTYLPYSYGDATGNQVRTRASLNDTTAYGDDSHRENYIDNMDIFIYRNDATADDEPIYTSMGIHYEQIDSNAHYKITESDGTIVGHSQDSVHKGCLYKIMLRVTDVDKKHIFGDDYDQPVKVALIANRPWSGYKDTKYSVQSLRETVVNTDWPSMNWNSYTFPMSGMAVITPKAGTKTVTIDGNTDHATTTTMATLESISGIVPLRRVAAKVQSYINVVDSAIVKNDEGQESEYFPIKDQIRVSFYNGATRTMIDSTLSEAELIAGKYFYDLRNRETKEVSITHYEDVYDENNKLVKEDSAVPYFYTHEQFYTYPREWSEDKSDMTSGVTADYDPRFVVMVPWKQRVGGTSGEASKFEPQFSTYYQFSANRLTHRFDRNTFYKLYIKITQPGSQTEAVPVDVTPLGYTIQPWGVVEMGNGIGDNVVGEFVSYQYLVVDPLTKVVKNSNSTDFSYSSSSTVTARVTYANFADYSTAGTTNWSEWTESDAALKDSIENHYFVTVDESSHTITVTHDLSTSKNVSHEIWVQVENAEGLTETIKIYQYPEIYIETVYGDNVFVDGYFAHVFNDGEKGYQNGYFYKNYLWYYDDLDGSYSKTMGQDARYHGTSRYSTGAKTGAGTAPYGTLYRTLNNSANALKNNRLIKVYVTAFTKDNGFFTSNGTQYVYKIGDPRVSAGYTSSNLTAYLTNVKGTGDATDNWDSEAAKAIMIGPEGTGESQQIIAPAFMLASAWASSSSHSFVAAQKRAATYQEAGYPAGRWRLPTEAEMLFCQGLQDDNLIPAQFGTSSSAYYWASSGRKYNSYTGKFYDADYDNSSKCFSRPVYDIWYWGEDSLNHKQYHIMPIKGGKDYATQR